MKKKLLIAAGLLSFVIGSVGVLLPILPTTPFLLLSGYCFTRSSESFDAWLKQTKLYQFYVADYAKNRSIPRNKKWKILLNIYVLMGLSIWMAPLLAVKVMLTLLTVAQTLFLFFKIPDNPHPKRQNENDII